MDDLRDPAPSQLMPPGEDVRRLVPRDAGQARRLVPYAGKDDAPAAPAPTYRGDVYTVGIFMGFGTFTATVFVDDKGNTMYPGDAKFQPKNGPEYTISTNDLARVGVWRDSFESVANMLQARAKEEARL